MSIDTDYAVLRTVLAGKAFGEARTLAQSPDPSDFGWAVEFGVYSGYSLGIIAERMPVIGFDSFEGLPEDWREGFPKGAFSLADAPGIRAGFPPPNAMIVPGWFEDTLPRFPFPPLGLVHIDCDLYSSTVTALNAVKEHITVGTVIVFDEYQAYPGWQQHEALAWHEFMVKYGVEAQAVASYQQEKAFVVTSLGWLR